MINGIIIGKETKLSQITTNVPENIKVPNAEKRFKRLFINLSVTEETFFMPFIQTLLNKPGLEEMVLAFDGSLVGRDCMCLILLMTFELWIVAEHQTKNSIVQFFEPKV